MRGYRASRGGYRCDSPLRSSHAAHTRARALQPLFWLFPLLPQVKKLQKTFQDELGTASSAAEETISSMRTVRSFSNEQKACDVYDTIIDKSYRVCPPVSPLPCPVNCDCTLGVPMPTRAA